MKLVLFGNGKTGKQVLQTAQEQGHDVLACFNRSQPIDKHLVHQADVCIDFSHASCVMAHLQYCLEAQKPLVMGTTGWEDQLVEAQQLVEKQAGTALYAPNFSLGLAIFFKILSSTAPLLEKFSEFEAVGVEYHHSSKHDQPSGTAKRLAALWSKPLPFTSVRVGHLPGKHEIIFDSHFETLRFSHETRDRKTFAVGALKAAEWIKEKKGWWTFDEMVRSLYSANHTVY